jgi:diguanylate cyclase (GGDEF)-like protein
MVHPIGDVSAAAQKIASGEFVEEVDVKGGADELEELSRSLRLISKNAKELVEKVEKLSPRDKLTGLYNASYIRERLDEEIQRAIHYQRPCAFAYFSIARLDEFQARRGAEAAEALLIAAAETFNRHMQEFDRAARISRNEFVAIFPDKNKKKAIEVIEAMGAELTDLFRKKGEADLAVSVGVSENPLDGVKADELYIKAQDRMRAARVGRKLLEAFL